VTMLRRWIAIGVCMSLGLGSRAAAQDQAPTSRMLLVPDVRPGPRHGFVMNSGMWQSPARFLVRRGAATLFVTDDGCWIRVVRRGASGTDEPLRERGAIVGVVDYRIAPAGGGVVGIEALDELPGRNNFFVGDENRWRTGVPSYGRLRLAGAGWTAEIVDGEEGLALKVAEGSRVFDTPFTCERWEAGGSRPITLQDMVREICGMVRNAPVSAATMSPTVSTASEGSSLAGTAALGVELDYSSFLGGSGVEESYGVCADGPLLIAVGSAWTPDFPWTPGAMDVEGVFEEAFITKFSADGSAFVFSTYLGGPSSDTAFEVAVGPDHSIYVAGYFNGPSFPTTPGAFDQTQNGGIFDGFLARLSPEGDQLIYATILGGSDDDFLRDMQLDAEGNAYAGGYTRSPDFPTTPGCYQSSLMSLAGENTFIAKVDPSGSSLVYSTYFGGSSKADTWGITVDATGAVYVTGRVSTSTAGAVFPSTPGAYDVTPNGNWDVFVAKFLPDGSNVVYATVIGANLEDDGRAIAVDAAGAAYVTGWTYSTGFPTTPGAHHSGPGGEDAFVCKLDPTGSMLEYSARIGGSGLDRGYDIAVSATGEAWITGQTVSSGFPVTPDAIQSTFDSGDAFVLGLSADGSDLLYSSFLGGAEGNQELGLSIDIDPAGGVCLAGTTTSNDFPLTPLAADPTFSGFDEAFVARFRALWPDLSGASPGIAGPPQLAGRGALLAGWPTAIALSDAPADTLYLAWLSFAPQPWQVLGGTLHAYPFQVQLLLTTDASGSSLLQFPWPAGIGPGITFTLQDIVLDPSVPGQLTLSNAVTAMTP